MISARKSLENIKERKPQDNNNWRLKLDKNDNIYGCMPSIMSVVKNTSEFDISKYPNDETLKKKFSTKYSINNENILFSNNANEVIRGIFDAYLEKDDLVVSYKTYKNFINNYALLNNIRLLNNVENNQFINKAKITYIATPNNITGELIKASYIELLLSEFRDTLFIIDCSYINFATNSVIEDYIDLVKKYENIIIVKSFEKDFSLVGIGFCYSIANKNIINNINKTLINKVNSIALNCASIVINDDKKIEEIKELNKNAKELFFNYLTKEGFTPYESQTNFILCNFNNYCDFYYEKLKQNNVITRNFPKNTIYNSCLRITIPTIGGVKFICELLNKKDVLIFSNELILNENLELTITKNTIKELSKKYDLVIYTKKQKIHTEELLIKYEINQYFYYIHSLLNSSELNSDELNKLKQKCPHQEIFLISSNIQDIIVSKMTNTKSYAVIMPNDDFNNSINSYKHLGVENIVADYDNLKDYFIKEEIIL